MSMVEDDEDAAALFFGAGGAEEPEEPEDSEKSPIEASEASEFSELPEPVAMLPEDEPEDEPEDAEGTEDSPIDLIEEEIIVVDENGEVIEEEVIEEEIDVENQGAVSKSAGPENRAYWMICLSIVGLLGAAGLVGWWLSQKDTDGDLVIEKDRPDITDPPTPAPSIGTTTAFDDIIGTCDFTGTPIPHVFDQCACFGEIQAIPEDVSVRYASHIEYFIPTLYQSYDDDISSCSARNQALVWLSSANDADFDRDERIQRFALATAFAGLGGVGWGNRTGWLSTSSSCSWYGIECDDLDQATTFDFGGNNAVGTLIPEIILLENLSSLLGASNKIEGNIPEGLFPGSLAYVDLSSNLLTGPVPTTVGDSTELIELNLSNNDLSGLLSTKIGGAANLAKLDLSSNGIEGEIPVELYDLTSLTELDISSNEFEGTIPVEIGQLTLLTALTLGKNKFTGDIQTEIGELTNLELLSIEDVDIAGRFPREFASLTKLVELVIKNTNVAGNIESDFGALPDLVTFDLSGNQIRNSLPEELGDLSSLSILSLENNLIDGEIPESFGDLSSLTELKLNNNLLTGGIPDSLADLEALEILLLDGNNLVDRVSNDMCKLRDGALEEFVVDCPDRVGKDNVGVICKVPDCCSACTPL